MLQKTYANPGAVQREISRRAQCRGQRRRRQGAKARLALSGNGGAEARAKYRNIKSRRFEKRVKNMREICLWARHETNALKTNGKVFLPNAGLAANQKETRWHLGTRAGQSGERERAAVHVPISASR